MALLIKGSDDKIKQLARELKTRASRTGLILEIIEDKPKKQGKKPKDK